MFSTALMATTSTPIEKNDKAVNSFPTAKTVKNQIAPLPDQPQEQPTAWIVTEIHTSAKQQQLKQLLLLHVQRLVQKHTAKLRCGRL